MKSGANRTEQNAIARLSKEGMDPDAISTKLQIKIDCVKSFIPKGKPGKKSSKLAAAFE